MDREELLCENVLVHGDIVDTIKKQMPKGEKLFDLADFFRLFGDSTRVQILYALDKHEMCVCDISSLLNMTASAVSHQLRLLRDADLVRTRRAGKTVYYSLADDHVRLIIECGMEHIEEGKE